MGKGYLIAVGIVVVIGIIIMCNPPSVSYDSSELEQKIVDDFNDIRAEKGLVPLTLSPKYYNLCLENSQYNADHPTYRAGQSSSERYVKVPSINSVSYPNASVFANVSSYGFLEDLDGDLESDAKKIVKDFMSDLFKGEDADVNPDGASVQNISISCVIKDGHIGTTFILFGYDKNQTWRWR